MVSYGIILAEFAQDQNPTWLHHRVQRHACGEVVHHAEVCAQDVLHMLAYRPGCLVHARAFADGSSAGILVLAYELWHIGYGILVMAY